MESLKNRLRTECSTVRRIEETFDDLMPKASTFYAGVSESSGSHIFFNFQHSSKSWEVGQFTINVIVSSSEKPKRLRHEVMIPEDARSIREGTYRIGPLLGGKDKWWRLKKDNPLYEDEEFDRLIREFDRKMKEILPRDEEGHVSSHFETWLPTNYDDDENVCNEAATNVIHDLRRVLQMLGANEPS